MRQDLSRDRIADSAGIDRVPLRPKSSQRGTVPQSGRLEQKGAELVLKVLESAVANAENNKGADIDELKIKSIYVEQGATLSRSSARAKGRGNRISKPTCHIFVTVGN